jgi:hypothetical protein
MGGDSVWDHINSCIHHNANWTRAHEHVLQTLDHICNAAGFAANHKRVLTSEGSHIADLEVCNISMLQKTDLMIDVTIQLVFVSVRTIKRLHHHHHPFISTGRSGHTQGQLRNPDNPDHILDSDTADKIRNCDPYQHNLQVAFLPACMSTSGRIHPRFCFCKNN